jgi:hypothetical protein
MSLLKNLEVVIARSPKDDGAICNSLSSKLTDCTDVP